MRRKYKIEKREASIFIKSSVSDSFPEIKEILSRNKIYPFLTNKEYSNLNDTDKTFIDKRFGELFSAAAKEWVIIKSTEEVNDNKIQCQLCGTRGLRWISRIKNKKTGEELVVGSECIKNYKEFRGSNGESFAELSRTQVKLKNEKMIEVWSEGILRDKDRILKLNSEFLIIPNYLQRKYKSTNEKVAKLEKELLKKSMNENKRNYVKEIHKCIKDFLLEFDQYKENIKSDDFGITDEIAKWLINQEDYETIEQLKKDGKITKQTISFVKEPKFMKKLIPKFYNLLANSNIELLNKINNSTFSIKIGSRPDIILNVKMAEFIKKYKDYLFDGKIEEVDINFLIRNSTITDYKSMLKSLDYIITSELGKVIKLKSEDYKTNELAFKFKNSNIYVVDFLEFINKFKKMVFNNTKENSAFNVDVLNYIKNNSMIYTEKEFEDHEKAIQGSVVKKKS